MAHELLTGAYADAYPYCVSALALADAEDGLTKRGERVYIHHANVDGAALFASLCGYPESPDVVLYVRLAPSEPTAPSGAGEGADLRWRRVSWFATGYDGESN